MNELLNEKLHQLLAAFTSDNITESDVAVKRIKDLFPDNDFKYGAINSATDFYVENKEMIHLSDNNESRIVISYPEGDRFGDRLSDPNTDIWIEYLNKDKLEKLPLFENNHVEKTWIENIAQTKEDITQDKPLTKEYILAQIKSHSDNFPPELPLSLLERANDELLLDKDIKKAVINSMKDIAEYDAGAAADQYNYGQYGGMDVDPWDMEPCNQFKTTHLPENVEKLYRQDIEDTYLQYEGVLDNLKKEKDSLGKEIKGQTFFHNNKDLILSYFEERNKVYNENKDFITGVIYNSPEFIENPNTIDTFDKFTFLQKMNLDKFTYQLDSEKIRYKLTKQTLDTFPSELNKKYSNINFHDLEFEVQSTKISEKKYLEKYHKLTYQKFKSWQFIQRRRNETELNDTIDKIEHTKNLSFYLDTKLENEKLQDSIRDLELTIGHGEKYNKDIEKLYSKFDDNIVDKIKYTIFLDDELSNKAAGVPFNFLENYQSIFADYEVDLNLLKERFIETNRQIARAEKILNISSSLETAEKEYTQSYVREDKEKVSAKQDVKKENNIANRIKEAKYKSINQQRNTMNHPKKELQR